MPRTRFLPLALTLFLPLALLGAPAHAEELPEGEPDATSEGHASDGHATVEASLLLQGKLLGRTITRDGEKARAYSLRIGKRVYELSGMETAGPDLRKATGTYVTIEGGGEASGEDDPRGVSLAGTVTFEVQSLAPLLGTVRRLTEAKKKRYVLETKNGAWRIATKDARRFKPFVDLHVAATCFRVSDGRYRAVAGVKTVARSLLPGERAPISGEEAIGAPWKGVLTATKVPKGIPGVKPGDFAIAFETDATLAKTTGRLMNAYDVVGVRLRKFKRKKRRATVEVAYSFGQGSYAIMLEGTFSADWKTFSGDWKSGFLGSGTFRLAYQAPKKNAAQGK